MALTKTQVSSLYVAIFNRASEGEGNSFWQNSGLDAEETANAMLDTTDAKEYFGSSLDSNQAFIEHIYANTLNKTILDDAEGIAYWVGLLDNGASRGEVVTGLIEAVAQYADSEDPVTKAAYDQFSNRVAVSNYMAEEVEKTPDEYAQVTGFDNGLTVTNEQVTVAEAYVKVNELADDHPIQGNDNNVITLRKIVNETVTVTTEEETTTYWGGPNGEKITIDSFYEMVRIATGQDIFEMADSAIDIDAGTVLTDVVIVAQDSDSDEDTDGDTSVTFTTATGEQFTTELALAQEHYEFLDSLIYYTDTEGNKVSRFSTETTTSETEESTFGLATVILTPNVNNGATWENEMTTDGDDLITAGQTELLHGAYIDGGEGTNTLEVSMKGVYAQPIQLLNIQNVYVENLANVYADYYDLTSDENSDGYDIPDYLDIPTAAAEVVLAEAAQTTAATAQGNAEGNVSDAQSNLDDALANNESNDNSDNDDNDDVSGSETVATLREALEDAQAALETANANLADANAALAEANALYLQSTTLVNSESILDLSNAREIENLVITEGIVSSVEFTDDNNDTFASQSIGDLTIVGVRNNAEVTLEGSFNSGTDVNVHYSQGLSDGLDVKLNLGEVSSDTVFNLFHNSNTINIDSVGGGNILHSMNLGSANLLTLNITGDAQLVIESSIANAFTGFHPAVIDASMNIAGVDLTIGGSSSNDGYDDEVIFTGTLEADDHFSADYNGHKVVITGGNGDNEFSAQDGVLSQITSGDGMNTINVDNTATSEVTVGNGNNVIGADQAATATIVAGDGNNTIDADMADMVTITTGNGDNSITANANTDSVTITTGSGDDSIQAADGVSVEIDAGDGNNTIISSATTSISITTGSGDDTVTISGNGEAFDEDETALVNIDLGEGTNTLVIGLNDSVSIDAAGDDQVNDAADFDGLTALAGSTIEGSNITLDVNNTSNLSQATISGVTAVSLDNETNLTLTAEQFIAIGASNFSVDGVAFGQNAELTIVISESMNFDALGISTDTFDCNNINLNIELLCNNSEEVTFTLSAAQLHEYIAEDGIDVNDANNYNNDQVIVTDAGLDFDPFDQQNGGTGAGTLESGVDVTVIREIDGYERPEQDALSDTLTINTDETPDVGAIVSSQFDTVNIEGAADFSGSLDLPENFTVDFSALTGTADITISSFENVATDSDDDKDVDADDVAGWGSIAGNGDARVNIELSEDATVGYEDTDPAAGGFNSSGVATYVVTELNGGDSIIHVCDNTQDVTTLGLQGNYDGSVTFSDVNWGIEFLLEGDGDAAYSVKDNGNPNYSNIGTFNADFFYESKDSDMLADAVVNINNQGVATDRPLFAEDIDITNAGSLTINVEDADAIIDNLEENQIDDITLNSANDVTITNVLSTVVNEIDASGVAGDFTVSSAIANGGADDADFMFTGSAGTTALTLTGDYVASSDSSFASAGELNVTIGVDGADTTVDLTAADVSGIDSIVVEEGDTLILTIAQSVEIGEANITGVDATATLSLVGLGEDEFSLAAYDSNLVSGGIELTIVDVDGDGVVTLHPNTDLTGVLNLVVPEGLTLNLTAAQAQQMVTYDGAGAIVNPISIEGIDSLGASSTMYTVNITDMMQSDADAGFDISNVDAVTISITLAESVILPADAAAVVNVSNEISTDISVGANDSLTINVGDDMTFGYPETTHLDGVAIIGGTNSTVILADADNTNVGSTLDTVDASGWDIDELHILDDYVVNENIDELFQGLLERVEKVIYFDEGDVSAQDQTVTIEAGGTFSGNLEINRIEDDVEIEDLTFNMMGGTILDGDLNVSSTDKNDGIDLLHAHLKTLTINSEGTEENRFDGGTANIITGDITSQGAGTTTDNNLLDITINATQELIVSGDVLLESVVGDDIYTLGDDDSATATITVNGDSDVTIGSVSSAGVISGLDSTDNDVDAVNVINNGTGTLTLVLDGANFDAADVLSFTGTGAIDLQVVGTTLDLSNDDLSGVTTITIGSGDATDGSATPIDLAGALTITQAQYDTLTFVDGTDTDATATINLVEFGSDPFDATSVPADIAIGTITLAEGNITLDPTTDLTGVGSLIVPEGSTLNLTAAQFQQLALEGTITGVDSTGTPSTDYTVNVTDLMQADVDRENDDNNDSDTLDAGETGLDFTGITADNVNVSLGEDVALDALTITTNVDAYIMSDNQTLTFENSDQANGVAISGGTNTTVVYQFATLASGTQIDTTDYAITILKALNTFVDGTNVEFIIENLDSSIELRIFNDPSELGIVSAVNRVVVIEENVDVAGELVFNDIDDDSAVETLTLTMEGGSSITGDLEVPTVLAGIGLDARYFETLTINSEGTTANTITGDINANDTGTPNPGTATEIENNLQNVVINADQDLVIGLFDSVSGNYVSGGDIVFSSNDTTAAANATLTLTGTANVTMHGVDLTDKDDTGTSDIASLTIDNNLGGTLTLTGGTPAILAENAESLIITGSGNIDMGTDDDGSAAEGISSTTLSTIDASGSTGDIDFAEATVDADEFSFVSGTGVTTIEITSDFDADFDGKDDDIATTADNEAGWSFDLSNAAAGSQLTLGGDATQFTTTGDLSIDLGANAVLYINADMDLTDLNSLSITQTQAIVLGAGVDLTLTAAQANALNIIADPSIITDMNDANFNAADVPTVTIEDLGDAEYDFSNILAGVTALSGLNVVIATLEDDDVTVHASTDLGDVTISLGDVADDADGLTANELLGQTIRFNTEEQAGRTILVEAANGDDSTNVIWLFDTIVSAPINTDGYASELDRLWFNQTLANGADIEDMFTSLPNAILRVDFADLTDLADQLTSASVNRIVELAALTSLPAGFVINDSDVLEHVETLTVNMGGEVAVGDIEIGNVIDNTGTYTTPTVFTSLTINSVLADDTGDLLAADGFDEEANVKPTSGNTVGDIFVGGTDTNIDLTNVTLATGVAESTNNLLADDGDAANDGTVETPANNVLTGTTLTTGRIIFDSDTAGTTATLNLSGANDITIAALDSSDAQVYSLAILNTNTATVTVTGASPAAAVNNTESLAITTDGDMYFGTDGDATKPGVSSNTLSNLTVNDGIAGNDPFVNLGVIAEVDSNDFTFTSDIVISNESVTIDLVGAGQVGDLVTVTVNGQAFTYTVDASPTTTEVVAAIVAAINDNTTGLSTVTAVATDADTITINADSGVDLDVTAVATDADGGANPIVFTVTETGASGGTKAVLDGADLAVAGVWTINNIILSIEDGSTFAAGDLTITNSIVSIDSDVDLTALTSLTLTGSTINVTEGNTLTLTVDQLLDANTPAITGSGTITIIGDVTDQAASIGAKLQAVNIDLSALTIEINPLAVDPDDDLLLPVTFSVPATNDFGVNVAHVVTGSDFDDVIIASTSGMDVTGGDGDDAYTGANNATDTFNVTEDTDTITDLTSDDPAGTVVEQDVLAVSAGATAIATVAAGEDFFATADTVNNGTATITSSANGTVDLSLATGTNGFTINGDASDASATTLAGSANDDLINGGDDSATNDAANDIDTLTGNAGNDIFEFNISTSTTATATESTTQDSIDGSTITVTADGVDDGDESITISYRVNGAVSAVVVDLAAIDPTDDAAVAVAIATTMNNITGISATSTLAVATIQADGINSVEILSSTEAGTTNTLATADDNSPAGNLIQQSNIDYSGETITIGEIYTVSIVLSDGTNIEGSFTTATTVVADLVDGLLLSLAAADIDTDLSFTDNGDDFDVDTASADDGGFTITTSGQGAVNGSSASDLGATDILFADIITDFTTGEDSIDLNLVAGSGTNYAEASEVAFNTDLATTYGDALTAASTAMDGTVQFYLTSIDQDGAGDSTGLLFFDANADGTVDGVINLNGVDSSNFAFTDIIA